MTHELSAYLSDLLVTFELRAPTLRAVIGALDLPRGSRGLDVGCGAGQPCSMLAEAVGPEGHVTGVDVAAEFIAHGEGLVQQAGLSGRVSLVEGSADPLPFPNDRFDWAWSVDCVGYGPWAPTPMLQEMARVVRPGGRVALVAWSSEKLLPGYPELEARLQATTAGLRPFTGEMPPERHLPRALGMLRELGLVELRARTFAGDVHAPLRNDLRKAMESLFAMRWPGVEDELSREELAAFDSLCRAGSKDFVLDHPDYYAFFTYSLFEGRLPG